MSNTPPIPAASQSPFPLHEKPHATSETSEASATGASKVSEVVKAAPSNVTSLAAQGGKFVQARPWAAAALFGTVVVALFGTLRGRRG